MSKSILEFDVGVIYVNDNNGGCTLGKIYMDDSGDEKHYFFEPEDKTTVFTAADLRKIADCLDALESGNTSMVNI